MEIIEYLVKEHDPTLIDAQVLVCIFACYICNCFQIVDLQEGMKPIHYASIQGSVNTFKALTKLGADPQSRTQDDVGK